MRIKNTYVQLKPVRIITALLTWFTFSFIAYAVFQLFRETMRFLTDDLGGRMLLVLTPEENYKSNLFFAAIASAIGYTFSTRLMLDHLVFDQRHTRNIRRAFNDHNFITWTYLLWFSKIAFLLGSMYITFTMQFDLDIQEDLPLFLLLFPAVWFLGLWPSLSQVFRKHKLKWFLGSLGVFLLMSFGLAFKNFTSYQVINKHILNTKPWYAYSLEKPSSGNYDHYWWDYFAINIHVVQDSSNTTGFQIFGYATRYPLQMDSIPDYIFQELKGTSYYEKQRHHISLHIDKDIPMSIVKQIQYKTRQAGISRILYSTKLIGSKYPDYHTSFDHSGLSQHLPEIYPDFVWKIDSVEKLDPQKIDVKIHPAPYYPILYLMTDSTPRLHYNVNNKGIFIEGNLNDSAEAGNKIRNFIINNAPDYYIIFNTSDDLSFENYIRAFNILKKQIHDLRTKMKLEICGSEDDYDCNYQIETLLKGRYPEAIIQWTDEEIRLARLVKKMNKKK